MAQANSSINALDLNISAEDIYVLNKEAVDSVYVPHTNFDAILKKILKRIKRNVGRKRGHRSLLATGFAGAGKTTLIGKILEQYPKIEKASHFELPDGTTGVCDHVPVLHIVCPTKATEKMVIKRLLKAMGDPLVPRRRDLDDLKDALETCLRAAGTAAIVVDEAQRPTDRRGKVTQGDIATLFQELHNQGCIVLLVGLARAEALLDEDTQVERRWARPLRLAQYDWGYPIDNNGFGPQARYIFMGLLNAVADVVDLNWASDIDLQSEEDAFRFYYASRGLVGYLKVLIKGAIDVLDDAGEQTITWSVLAEAFENEFRNQTKTGTLQNPFKDSFVAELPPPLPDDAAPLYPSRTKSQAGSRGSTKKARRAELTERLTL